MKIRERLIEDSTLSRAADFAAGLIADGTPPGLAIWTAANEYDVDKSDVARLCGKSGRFKKKLKADQNHS